MADRFHGTNEDFTDNCAHCGGPKAQRNPTGNCDHLYWPDYLSSDAKRANGIGVDVPKLTASEMTALSVAARELKQIMELSDEQKRCSMLADTRARLIELWTRCTES